MAETLKKGLDIDGIMDNAVGAGIKFREFLAHCGGHIRQGRDIETLPNTIEWWNVHSMCSLIF